ncbi:acyl-CoA synthetase [Vibrio owensii]|uniref:acyl-CoA synthetase n=1 Tax=Vibrio owensii TaxID=696485 RepID=UPI0033972811
MDSAEKNLNLIVHIQKGKEKYGYEWGTRQAWKCGEKAHRVKRVIGVVKGKIACIVDGVSAEVSTPTSNPNHDTGCEGRYVFVGGTCVSEKDLCVGMHGTLMFKKISGLGQGHRYLTDEELFSRID